MSRSEPDRPSLPGPDVPSADVLDELLRAFAVDVTDIKDRARLDRIDLTSPEVEELLAPGGQADRAAPAPPETDTDTVRHVEDDPQRQVEVEPDPHVQVERQVEGQVEGQVERHVEPSGTPAATIVISAGDELPDAVYLAAGDPLLNRTVPTDARPADHSPDASGPVFIDDHLTGGEGELISLEAATGAAHIEPRLRERRIAVKRARGRKRLKWAFLVVVVVGLVVAGLAVLGSGLFAIEDVVVDGAVYTDQEALNAVVAELEGSPVLRADTDAAERALEAIAWVEDARVTTDFPRGATIEIRERRPVASFQGPDGAFRVIDVDGRVLDVLDAQPAAYLVVTTPEPPALEVGQFASQGFRAAASLVQALTPEMRALAGAVAVTPDGSDLRLSLTNGIEVRFGAARDLVTKLVRLQTWLARNDGTGFSSVDVSTNEVTTR